MKIHRFQFCLLAACALPCLGWSSDWSCVIGPRVEKTWELYWENGVDGECSFEKILWGHLGIGASVTSTRIGSAWESNALRQEQYLLNFAWNFRLQKRVQPYVSLSGGWFWLDVGPEIFNEVPHSSPLAMVGTGARLQLWGPLSWKAGIGYHLITGDGLEGPGSLYPLILHSSVQWRFPR